MRKNNAIELVAITTGDQDGIGPEVTYKALAAVAPKAGAAFIVFRSAEVSRSILKTVDKHLQRVSVSSLDEALALKFTPEMLIEIVSKELPPRWVEESAHAATEQKIGAIVSAPLSKTLIHKARLKELGHTEILTRVAKSKPVTMSFWGPQFSVALGSTHISLKEVSSQVSANVFVHHLRNVARYFPKPRRRGLRIGVVGLNPHAGESGLIGTEEKSIFAPSLKTLRKEFPDVMFSDPLVPDAAFLPASLKAHDVFFCMYHDQGLIPFKMAHGQSRGCQISLGLPFVRTSVDHGTAKDLFGKNRANIGSMVDALETAVQLLNKK